MCHNVSRSGAFPHLIMFRGRSKHTLDDKGRLAIPTRFKDTSKLKEQPCLVVTNHINCLWAFPKEDWRIIEDKIANLPLMDKSVNSLRRYFISGAQECLIKQGRITLPPDLREIAGLKKEVMLIGETKYFEIWDKSRWDEEFNRVMDDFPESSQTLGQLGI
jgi:MraZ protein